jgi:protein involved in polysaccharide export with SLBB domain
MGFGAGGTVGGAGVGVLGEVAKPGVYPVGPGQDLWQMLAVAGGLTPDGDLTRVRVITTEGGKYAVSTINLREVLDKSGRTPRMVKTGDIVFVSPTGSSQFGRFWGGFQGVLGVARGVYDIVVIQQLLEDNR